ncbi:ABC transporter ATP-binding protein [Methylovirgula sp. 4M-Z18]|uniref:ABC transporter ATP-binding protein n=1 Tax=Methylovirgula sp. 4M-Z18 TaxID=2293567 RepID=UPI000E2EED47|nr:sn-glycerol-3-phosphate ABC transporter ATP-binding protein UgpC [Methylovirgula sp. 4M-Z18]RFB76508.1 sn-glycerol-3-phosphate ABC transporter ATP-binding protein UgpC [Methylovirgula sp. 4M-Z18]
MATVNLRSVAKNFGAVEVIHGIDIDIADGEFVVLVGPSGCGKSTLLRMIAGLESISGGELRIGARLVNDIPPKSRDIAMVFQNYALYPHMTVRENMGFSLKLSRVPKEKARTMIARAADILDLSELLDRYPRQLSGGQRQRVAMGRAIVRDPAVFLFDEPLSNLDAALRVQMRVELAQLHQRLGTTMIYVTHDQTEAMTLADKIAVVNRGRIEQVASPLDLYHRPRNLFVARFIGSPQMNFLKAQVSAVTGNGAGPQVKLVLADGATIAMATLPGRLSPGEEVLLGIRPEALLPSQDGPITGTVRLVEHLGGLTLLHVGRQDGDPMIVQAAGNDGTRVGNTVRLTPLAEGMHIFDTKGMRVGADA